MSSSHAAKVLGPSKCSFRSLPWMVGPPVARSMWDQGHLPAPARRSVTGVSRRAGGRAAAVVGGPFVVTGPYYTLLGAKGLHGVDSRGASRGHVGRDQGDERERGAHYEVGRGVRAC